MSGTTWVSNYQKDKTDLDFTKAVKNSLKTAAWISKILVNFLVQL